MVDRFEEWKRKNRKRIRALEEASYLQKKPSPEQEHRPTASSGSRTGRHPGTGRVDSDTRSAGTTEDSGTASTGGRAGGHTA